MRMVTFFSTCSECGWEDKERYKHVSDCRRVDKCPGCGSIFLMLETEVFKKTWTGTVIPIQKSTHRGGRVQFVVPQEYRKT